MLVNLRDGVRLIPTRICLRQLNAAPFAGQFFLDLGKLQADAFLHAKILREREPFEDVLLGVPWLHGSLKLFLGMLLVRIVADLKCPLSVLAAENRVLGKTGDLDPRHPALDVPVS